MDSPSNSITAEAASLLRERYGYLRAEMLQRMENRYKLLTTMLALVAVGFTVAVQLQKDAIALPVCATMLVLALVLQGENRHVQLISNYLIAIERHLDAHYGLKTVGWERFSRARKGEKKLASSHLTLGALGFLTCFYVVFGAVAVRWIIRTSGRRFEPSEWLVISLVSLALLIPLIGVLALMWFDYRRLWRDTAR